LGVSQNGNPGLVMRHPASQASGKFFWRFVLTLIGRLLPALGVLSLSLVGTATAAKYSGKPDFLQGQALLSQGKIAEAYEAFSRAAATEPGNKKFQRKKAEIGAALSDKALFEAEAAIDNDPNGAAGFIGQALRMNPDNARARQISDVLAQRVAAAKATLNDAQAAADRGDADLASKLVDSLSPFRRRDTGRETLLSFDKVDAALRNTLAALQLRRFWKDGKIELAVDALHSWGTVPPDGRFASTAVAQVRRAIVDTLIARAQSGSAQSASDLIQRVKLLQMVLRADPSSTRPRALIAETASQLSTFLAKPTAELRFAREASAGRFRLGLDDVVTDLVGERPATPAAPNEAANYAYPALTFTFRVDDRHSCLSSDVAKRLEFEVAAALQPVAKSVQASGDMEVRVTDISCSQIDIPRQSVQSVNSTYVAGQNQLANPTYVQIQSILASAEANLNRAYAAYQSDPSIVNTYAYGLALRQVRDARTELANTPPYAISEILQAYQYQKFEALSAAGFKGTIRVRGIQFSYSVAKEVASNREERRSGVSGVLPGDKSGATNVDPALSSIDALSMSASAELVKKTVSEVRAACAGYYAAMASDEREPVGDRIAAMLYLTDLSAGTEYERDVNQLRTQFQIAVQGDAKQMLEFGKSIKLRYPEQVQASPSQPQDAEGSVTLERVLDGVVAIETDQGAAGTGFFAGQKCSVITNEHVISGATTIVLKTSTRRLYLGQVLARDTVRDLAILTTNAPDCFELVLEDATVGIGTEVFAVGNPLGLEGTVTRGIVSATRITSSGVKYIQIDAGLNPGNSGGPLVNQRGRVLGVTTFKLKGYEGLNFAVAADEVRAAFGRLLGVKQ
jgi:S1-C subfamily serine protease